MLSIEGAVIGSYRGESNEPDTLHLYAYCANNPINYVDPSGHLSVKVGFVSVAIDTILTIFAG